MTKITLEIKKRSITFLYNRGLFYLLPNKSTNWPRVPESHLKSTLKQVNPVKQLLGMRAFSHWPTTYMKRGGGTVRARINSPSMGFQDSSCCPWPPFFFFFFFAGSSCTLRACWSAGLRIVTILPFTLMMAACGGIATLPFCGCGGFIILLGGPPFIVNRTMLLLGGSTGILPFIVFPFTGFFFFFFFPFVFSMKSVRKSKALH